MALSNPAMILAANALRGAITHGQLHTSTTTTSGTANLTTAPRQALPWAAATANGDFGLSSAVAFTGGAANGPVAAISLWSAITGGIFYGDFPLTGDTTFNSAGEYTLTSLNIDGNAT